MHPLVLHFDKWRTSPLIYCYVSQNEIERTRWSSLSLHIHEQPLVARQLSSIGKVAQRCQAKANPAKILDHGIALGGVGVAVDADDKAVAGEGVDFAEFEEGHEPDHALALDTRACRCYSPSLQISVEDSLIKKDKHGLLVVLFGHEAAELYPTNVIPHLHPFAQHRLRAIRLSREVPVRPDAIILNLILILHLDIRTHCKRVLASRFPLTQENRPQCPTEEPLTLSRNGVRCRVSATETRTRGR